MEMQWVAAGEISQFEEGLTGRHLGGIDLLIVRRQNDFRIFADRCPHQGALLSEGELLSSTPAQRGRPQGDEVIVCRNHRWKFSADKGKRQGGPQCLQGFDCKIEAETLKILLPAQKIDSHSSDTIRLAESLPGPKGIPVLGNSLQIDKQAVHRQLEVWAREFGPMYRFKLGPYPLVAISDGQLIADILKQRPDIYRRAKRIEPIFQELGIEGVFSAEGESWRPQRKLAVAALANRNLRGFFPTLQLCAKRLMRRWQRCADQGSVVDIQSDLMRFTVDVTTMLAFGHDINTLEDKGGSIQDDLEPVFPLLADRLQALVPYWRVFNLPRDRKVNAAIKKTKKWLAPIIQETRERLRNNPELEQNPSNFLEAMLSSQDEKGEAFSDDLVFGNAMTMLLAGEDTTANTLAWAVHHLIDAPNALADLQNEIDLALGENLIPSDFDNLRKMSFTNAVANETMRLRPVAPLLFADPIETVVVDGVQIDSSYSIALLLRPAATAHGLIPRSQAFMPKRWLDSKQTEAISQNFAHMPFGSGPRICPGRSLAQAEILLVLAMLYKNFDIERVGHASEVQELFSFTMIPVGLKVKLHRRKTSD